MANSVDKILSKFTSVVQELEDHAAKKNWQSARWQAAWTRVERAVQEVRLWLTAKTQELEQEAVKAEAAAKHIRASFLGE